MSELATFHEPQALGQSSAASKGNDIILVGDARPWQMQALVRLEEIGNLAQSWDGYDSPPVSYSARDYAQKLIFAIEVELLRTPQIGPCSGGALQINWASGSYELELHVLPNRSVEYLKVINDNPADEGTIRVGDIDSVRRLIGWLLQG